MKGIISSDATDCCGQQSPWQAAYPMTTMMTCRALPQCQPAALFDLVVYFALSAKQSTHVPFEKQRLLDGSAWSDDIIFP
jgi:hypothetical protein